MITQNRRVQCNNRTTEQMAKINYSQQEKDAIASMQTNDVLALNIKRIARTAPARNIKLISYCFLKFGTPFTATH